MIICPSHWLILWWLCIASWFVFQPASQIWVLCCLGQSSALASAALCALFYNQDRMQVLIWFIVFMAFNLAQRWRVHSCSCQSQVNAYLARMETSRTTWMAMLRREWEGAAVMVETSLEQLSPGMLYSQHHEILSPCCMAVPVTNLSGIHTVMRHLRLLASNMHLLSQQNPPRSSVQNEFDISMLVQTVGDGLAALASRLSVSIILHNIDNILPTFYVLGDESAIRQTLFSLIHNIMDDCTAGACIEIGVQQQLLQDSQMGKCAITFNILHTPSCAQAPAPVSPATHVSKLTSALATYSHGRLESCDSGFRLDYCLAMGSDHADRRSTFERSMLDLRYNIQYASEPTLTELTAFLTKLKGIRMLIYAPERSIFAKHLTSCLAGWNADISHIPILRYRSYAMSPSCSTPTTTVSSSATSAPSPSVSVTPAVPSATAPTSTPSNNPAQPTQQSVDADQQQTTLPAFILIDDDLPTLERLLQEYKKGLPPRRAKQLRAIVYFAYLHDVRRLREMIMQVCAVVQTAPRVIIVPNPCGPRRFLTALHLAWIDAVVDPQFTPIATCPTHIPLMAMMMPASTPPSLTSQLMADKQPPPQQQLQPTSSHQARLLGSPSPSSRNEDMGYFAPRPSHPNMINLDVGSPAQRTLNRRLRSHSHSVHRRPDSSSCSSAPPMASASGSPGATAAPPMPPSYALEADGRRAPTDRTTVDTALPSRPLSVTPTNANVKSPASASLEHRNGPKYKLSHRKRDKSKPTPWWCPPINVLIVEDNIINQAILSTWMKKHKIQYEVASDGKQAVDKWQNGAFHLILMDIQLPVMSGIDATKTIRAMEKDEKIGVLTETSDQFKSPVIIVALTASSLESDRQAALAAGCNDFLTKPVSLEWLEKKILEWGCMQALIDVEGWRQWKRTTDPPASTAPHGSSLAHTHTLADLKQKENMSSPNLSNPPKPSDPVVQQPSAFKPQHSSSNLTSMATDSPTTSSPATPPLAPGAHSSMPRTRSPSVTMPSSTTTLATPSQSPMSQLPLPLRPSLSTSSSSSNTSASSTSESHRQGLLLKGANTLATKRFQGKPKMIVQKSEATGPHI
ncbi:hypothetical protein DM01DRAFT_1331130 [Hesseltinella vesiculosa]|uniref:Response regulatory domain-containing protein n=1 Tax=Hesseltinella vesiculosa TaxID=101127 RepID=A0A1X2GY66_9FUNG|nr:hypothetical protein DM01DRAFT_1331130 [Hesseltinella vesiculosa]